MRFLDALATPGGKIVILLFLVLMVIFVNHFGKEVDEKIKYLILGMLVNHLQPNGK